MIIRVSQLFVQYGFVKRIEHFIKGLSNTESQISAIPPVRYGERFIHFISSVTKSRELAEREVADRQAEAEKTQVPQSRQNTDMSIASQGVSAADLATGESEKVPTPSLDRTERMIDNGFRSAAIAPHGDPEKSERVLDKAERQAEHERRHGDMDVGVSDRQITAKWTPSIEGHGNGTPIGTVGNASDFALPVVEEVGENGDSDKSVTRHDVKDESDHLRVNGNYLHNGQSSRVENIGHSLPQTLQTVGPDADLDRRDVAVLKGIHSPKYDDWQKDEVGVGLPPSVKGSG